MRTLRSSAAALLLAFLVACGNGGGGSGSPSPSPTPSPGASTAANPCASITLQEQTPDEPRATGRKRAEPDPRLGVFDLLWTHRIAQARGLITRSATPVVAEDIGDVAVMQDQGDIIARSNLYDVRGVGLRFSRNAEGGYDLTPADPSFRQALGTKLTLTDDDSAAVAVPFEFPFFGRPHTAAFVNSDGNITFGEEDRASTARDVTRFLTGPPRVAAYFTDLDPSTAGGVFVNAAPDAFTVTWCNVRAFESTRSTTVQATMLPDGAVEMKFATSINIGDTIVGLSPGRTGDFTPVDLSAAPQRGGAGAVGERFSARNELDAVALARKFYATHPDSYEQLVIWSDVSLVRAGTFAQEVTIANNIRGIGLELFDTSRDFGSAGGRLHSLVMMDALPKYPEDPTVKFLGENSTLSVLGQEVGHRWLAFMRFRDHTGAPSDALLGRDDAHWSFFMDSDASVLEGNDIQDLGGGSFRTVGAVSRYSLLDQYAMGLVPEHEVPPFFYVADPVNPTPFKRPESDPQIGVTFNGTRRDVLIQDIVAVMGPRQPDARESPRVLRQAFIYVVSADRALDRTQVDKLERIRREWEGFFSRATDGRMRAETRLRTGT